MIYRTIFRRRFFQKMKSTGYIINEFVDITLEIIVLSLVYYMAMGNKANLNGISFNEIVTYLIFGRGLYVITLMNSDKLANKVFKGKFVFEFLKPYSYNGKVLSEAAADFCAGCLTKIIPLLIIAFVINRAAYPPDLMTTVLFVISFILGAVMWCNIQLLCTLLGFWTKDVYNVFFCITTYYAIICGGTIPYSLLPQKMSMILKATPFYYVISFPMDVYFDKLCVTSIVCGIAISIAYIAIFAVLAKFVFKIGKRNIQQASYI